MPTETPILPTDTMKKIIENTRTFRKFKQSEKISLKTLEELVELGRLGGSARNCQPWQYHLVTAAEECAAIFPYLGWAGYLSDWKGPEEGERPAAYILCCLNKEWLKGSLQEAYFDLGIATQNMLLGATDINLGGCRIGAFSPKLAELYEIPEHLELHLVIALGTPAEEVVVEECQQEGDIKYWRDSNLIHHVPKRKLSDVMLQLKLR